MAKFNKLSTDPRGGHVRLYWVLLDSMAWRALGWADQGLYIAMRRKLQGSNNGNIEATLATLRHSGITSTASLAKGLRALLAVGLIDRTRQGGLSQGRKVCNLFRFTDEPVLEHPKLEIPAMKATNDWREHTTLASAQAAIQAAHKASLTGKPRQRKNASPVQPLNRTSSAIEVITPFTSSKTEVGDARSVQKLKSVETAELAVSPHGH